MRTIYSIIAMIALMWPCMIGSTAARVPDAPDFKEPAEYVIGKEIGPAMGYMCTPDVADRIWAQLTLSFPDFKRAFDQEVEKIYEVGQVTCAVWKNVWLTPDSIEACIIDEYGYRWTRVAITVTHKSSVNGGPLTLFTLSNVVDTEEQEPYKCMPQGRGT